MIEEYEKFRPVYEEIRKEIEPELDNLSEVGAKIEDMVNISKTLHIDVKDKALFLDGLREYFNKLGITTRDVETKKNREEAIMFKKEISKIVSEEEIERLRKEIMSKFEGKNVSLNQLLSEYGSNDLVDVSVGEPDSPFDYGRWKDQLEKFKDAGASDIVLMEVSEGGYADAISLQTNIIRILVTDPTIELMGLIEDLDPESITLPPPGQEGYIELFFHG